MFSDTTFSSTIFLVIAVMVCSITAQHKPSPHGFDCPPKKTSGGMAQIMTCASKFKFMLETVCKPKYGFETDLITNLIKHVFFHAIKCIDVDFEHFLVDGVVDCMVGETSPGAKMMCNVKTSVCDSKLQNEMVSCMMKEVKLYPAAIAKMMSMIGHLSKLCHLLADGTYRECKTKWADFPPLPIK